MEFVKTVELIISNEEKEALDKAVSIIRDFKRDYDKAMSNENLDYEDTYTDVYDNLEEIETKLYDVINAVREFEKS